MTRAWRDAPLLDMRARAAWGLTLRRAPAGAVIVGPGVVLRVRKDGSLEELLPGGYPRPGPASDPANVRSHER